MNADDTTSKKLQEQLFELRRTRLRLLLNQFETMTHFAAAIGEPLNYTSRLVKPHRLGRKNIGEGKARKIETALGLPKGWLDQEDASPVPLASAPNISRAGWPFSFSRKIWDGLNLTEQRRAESMLLTIISGIEAERAVIRRDQEDVG